MDDLENRPGGNILTHGEAEKIEKEILAENQCLKKFSVILFVTLSIASIVGAITILHYWIHVKNPDQITNAYSAFLGFICAAVLNIIASCGGIVSLYENDWEMNEPHSEAVIALLLAGLIFNIVFPTTALLPLEIDSRRRIFQLPVMECYDEVEPFLKGDPACADADLLVTCIYCMYPLIALELIATSVFSYIKYQQFKVLPKLKIRDIMKHNKATKGQRRRDSSDDDDDDSFPLGSPRAGQLQFKMSPVGIRNRVEFDLDEDEIRIDNVQLRLLETHEMDFEI